MRIGVMFETERPFEDVVAQVAGLADAGIETAWASQIFAYDALTTIAAVGREVAGIDFGTAVVPTYPRHPVMLAAQALTVQAATGGRLTLGIGLSHQLVIENVFGQSFDKPARHMREYLSILMPLLEGEPASFAGETLSASTFGPLQIEAPTPPVLVAALGTTMLTHRRTDGLRHGHLDDRPGDHRVPHHPHHPVGRHRRRAARAAHRGGPARVRDRRRRRGPGQGRRALRHLRPLPSYRAMLDREGAGGPADVAIVGTESEVQAQIRRLADIGTTDFCGAPFGIGRRDHGPRSVRWPAWWAD